MTDLTFIVAAVVFFALTWSLVALLERVSS